MKHALIAALWLAGPSSAFADESDRRSFVEANLLAVFYHELGHAVIDLMGVPIFGQEEDAADVAAVLLIDWLHEEDAARGIAADSAFGHLSADASDEIAWWDLHGPDEQRYYNHVCLFVGASPDERADLAGELGLPKDRAETCPEEYAQAEDAWGEVFDAMEPVGESRTILFEPPGLEGADGTLLADLLAEEIAALNDDLTLPEPVTVRLETCGEANAFYDPGETAIIMCTEFVPHLREIHRDVSTD